MSSPIYLRDHDTYSCMLEYHPDTGDRRLLVR